MPSAARITDLFPVPPGFDAIASDLGEVLGRIGLRDFSITTRSPLPEPDGVTDVPELDESEAFAGLEWFGDEEETEPPVVTIPQDAAPALPAAGTVVETQFELEVLSEILLELPGMNGLSFVFSPSGFTARFTADAEGFVLVFATDVGIRFSPTVLRPYRATIQGDGTIAFEPDDSRSHVQINLANLGITIDHTAAIRFDVAIGIQLSEPAMIGDTGLLIERADIELNLSGDGARPAGTPPQWKGVMLNNASLRIPSVFSGTFVLSGFGVGSAGVSGTLNANFAIHYSDGVFTGDLVGTVFGMQGGLSEISLTLQQNIPVAGGIKAKLTLPFFESTDQPLDVDIGLTANGHFTVAIDGPNGLVMIDKPGVLSMTLDSIGFEVIDDIFTARLSGKLTPLFDAPALDWPSFEVKELSMDSEGNVRLEGGWLDLHQQSSLNFHGFQIEISKIGFGRNDDGRNWMGFSGSVRLLEGFSAGTSVEGLRILWNDSGDPDPKLTLNGLGVELTVPNTLSIQGTVAFVEESKKFIGAVSVDLPSLELTLTGQLVAGQDENGAHSLAVYVDAPLPAGTPIGSTGLSIYGVSGLFVFNREPDRKPGEGWYRNPDFSDGWFTRNPKGITHLEKKWRPAAGQLGFGAGVTLGTSSDDGYTFNGRLLLALIFPGPIVLIEGRANLFRKRAELDVDSAEPAFHAVAVLDVPKREFLVGMDAQYKYKSKGELLDLRGNAEAFFDLDDPSAWHIWLGIRDPKRRLRARAFQLFEVNAFFMLGPRALEVGEGWSFQKSWTFGRLGVRLVASLEGEAVVSWRPNHFTGTVSLQGRAELRAFGRGVGLSVAATILGDVFDPYQLTGKFRVGINLPWPLPDIKRTVTLEWKRALTQPPPLPLPLREVAVEYLTPWREPTQELRWPLRRGESLLPNLDQGDFEFRGGSSQNPSGTPTAVPVVPADAKIGLVFGRPVADPAAIGNNPTIIRGEVIGDLTKLASFTVSYTLRSVALQKFAPQPQGGWGWTTVAEKGLKAKDSVPPLSGSWDPLQPPQLPEVAEGQTKHAQVKLLLGAKSPFERTARSRTWLDWFERTRTDYPCHASLPSENRCGSFSSIDSEEDFGEPGEFVFPPPAAGFRISWQFGGSAAWLDEVEEGEWGTVEKGLRLADHARDNQPGSIKIEPPPGATDVKIRVGTPETLLYEPLESSRPRGTFLPSDRANPLKVLDDSVTITTYEFKEIIIDLPRELVLRPENVIRDPDKRGLALELADRVEMTPAEPALVVELQLVATEIIIIELRAGDDTSPSEGASADDSTASLGVSANIVVIDSTGKGIPPLAVKVDGETLRLRAKDLGLKNIAKVTVEPVSRSVSLYLRRIYVRTPVTAFLRKRGVDVLTGPVEEQEALVTVRGEEIAEIFLGSRCGGEFVLLEVCLGDVGGEINRHVIETLEQFKQDGPLLEPQTDCRLVITTGRADNGTELPPNLKAGPGSAAVIRHDTEFLEQAYFRIAGPPGIGVPDLPPSKAPVDAAKRTGLEDLGLYVSRTVPSAPAGQDKTPILPRGVYRAYDVRVEFRVPYVELMYKLARRDLTLRVFDSANRPVVDDGGRVVIPASRWTRLSNADISDHERRWIRIVNGMPCRGETDPFDENSVLRNQLLAAPDGVVVLAPETLYQARLVPALLSEGFVNPLPGRFADGLAHELERWKAENRGTAPSRWEVRSEQVTGPEGPANLFYVTETSKGQTVLTYVGPGAAPDGNSDHPSRWTDLRATAKLRWNAGEIGLEVRRDSANALLRFTLNRPDGARKLIALKAGTATVLHEDTNTLGDPDNDVQVTIECIGNQLTVLQDGALAFASTTSVAEPGTVALFVNGAEQPRFADVRVDDLRPDPSTAFRFDFVTSKYTNFHHHLHSFDGRSFEFQAPFGTPDLAGLLSKAVPVSSVADEIGVDEHRNCETLLGEAEALRRLERVEVLRLTRQIGEDPTKTEIVALLVRSPEPILWERITLQIRESRVTAVPVIPARLKLSALTFATMGPEDESVTVLVRERSILSGYRLESRPLPSSADDDPSWTEYYQFGAEIPFDDGVQVRVFSGAEVDAPAPEPGTKHRFLSSNPAEAVVHFGDRTVELRLIAPNGSVADRRVFVTDDALAKVQDARVLRLGDGTSFFLFAGPPSGEPRALKAPHLQLGFTFAREKDGLAVLAQGGSANPEAATLDVILQ